jgi:hypothetical protein
VSASIRRLVNSCLSRGFSIHENGSPLNDTLRRKLNYRYMECMKAAVEMAIACGFVAFYVRRVAGVKMPFVPALGTFVWEVVPKQRSDRKRKLREQDHCLVEYKVKVLVADIKDEELHIVNWMTPVYTRPERPGLSRELPTPLKFVVAAHRRLEVAMQAAIDKEVWNCQKHVIISETVDLKDPTPSGIQLLDEMRRYTLTGSHANENNQRLFARDGQRARALDTVVHAKFHFIQSEFQKQEGEKDVPIQTHILPPNMTATEMGALEKSDTLDALRDNFHSSVYTFFNGSSPLTTTGSKYVGTAAQDHVSRAQQVAVMAMCSWLALVCRQFYATCFDIDEDTVRVKLAARSRFEINTTDDVKKLLESQVLTPYDCKQLREWYMSESGYDKI